MANEIETASAAESERTAESVTESGQELASRFAALVAKWKEGTRHCSMMARMAKHPAYREIVAMGPKVVPLILAELEKNGGFGFLALAEITGAAPQIPEGGNIMHGAFVGFDIKGIEAAWIAWGREQGYRW